MRRSSSKSGGTLRHTTGQMKIQYMHMVMDFKSNLKELQEAEYQRRIDERLGYLMCEMRDLDALWETWFDDDTNVPNVTHAQIIPHIERRIAALKIPHPIIKSKLDVDPVLITSS